MSAEKLVKAADRCLYESKNAGRDSVTVVLPAFVNLIVLSFIIAVRIRQAAGIYIGYRSKR